MYVSTFFSLLAGITAWPQQLRYFDFNLLGPLDKANVIRRNPTLQKVLFDTMIHEGKITQKKSRVFFQKKNKKNTKNKIKSKKAKTKPKLLNIVNMFL